MRVATDHSIGWHRALKVCRKTLFADTRSVSQRKSPGLRPVLTPHQATPHPSTARTPRRTIARKSLGEDLGSRKADRWIGGKEVTPRLTDQFTALFATLQQAQCNQRCQLQDGEECESAFHFITSL